MRSLQKKILIADDCTYWTKKILASKEISKYQTKFTKNGFDCLDKIKSFSPDLIILKLMLPQIHAVEILSIIRKDPKLKKIGVIITSSKQMIQDYHAVTEAKADYFLIKPYTCKELFRIIDLFFEGKLKPAPFAKIAMKTKGKNKAPPKLSIPKSYIKFWGTRGSITVAGTKYTRFGGNTCSLEIKQDEKLIIIDAGTGIRELGFEILKSDIKTIHIFLSHTHWDHIIGFPFFEPLYQKKYEIHIWAPRGFGRGTKDLFTDLLAYEFFPIRLDEVQAKIKFHEIKDRIPVKLSKDLKLDFHFTFHPGMTYCFKIYTKNQIIGYATDNEILMGFHGHPNEIKLTNPKLEPHRSLIDFFSECDLLIHEAQYTDAEYEKKVGWGHSSISNAAILLKYTKSSDWIVTHHDPMHSDRFLIQKQDVHKAILKDCKIATHLSYAFDGLIMSI